MNAGAMLETEGRVVAIDGDRAVIEARPRAGCSGCANGCGVGRLLGGPRAPGRLRIANDARLAVGDRVVLGIPDRQAASAALLGYGLPLVTTLLVLGVALVAGAAPVWHPAAALLGLVGGLALLGACNRRRPSADPRLVRRLAPAAVCCEIPDEPNQGAKP